MRASSTLEPFTVTVTFAVHGLIAKGRMDVDEEDFVWVDGVRLGKGGYRFE